MRYLPHTPEDIQSMLSDIGVASIAELFKTIPDDLVLKKKLNIPDPSSEMELSQKLASLAKKNQFATDGALSFLGGGAYNHYIPSAISKLVGRGEFFTSYTPYQAEVSQGTLQALFEYQTMLSEITQMEVVNASNYDASTACAEALLMAQRVNRKTKALVAANLNPQYIEVIQTYLKHFDFELEFIDFDASGKLDYDQIKAKLSPEVGALMIQSPNFFGVIEDLQKIQATIQDQNIFSIMVASEAISLGLLNPPGAFDADVAILEGQSLGIPVNYGGPYLGIFATKQKYVRQMPGRVVGQTVDAKGKPGYVLTFSTREQHIRREKATSNICTNQGLCALMASVYLSLMGKEGFYELAKLNFELAEYAKEKLTKLDGVELAFGGPTFNEFVLKVENGAAVFEKLAKQNIVPGLLLEKSVTGFENGLLVCVTEAKNPKQIDLFVEKFAKALG